MKFIYFKSIIFLSIFSFILYPNLSENQITPKQMKKHFSENSYKMAEIIKKYQDTGVISLSGQRDFQQMLNFAYQYEHSLSPAAAALVQEKFVRHYEWWAEYMKLSEEDQLFEKNSGYISSLFSSSGDKLTEILTDYVADLESLISGMGEYDTSAKNRFFIELDGYVVTTKSLITSWYKNTVNQFFDYIRRENQQLDPLNLTPDQQEVVSGLKSLADDALLKVRALSVDITSQSVTTDLEHATEDALAQYDYDQEAQYNQMVEYNKIDYDEMMWGSLKDSGINVLKKTAANFGEEFGKNVARKAMQILKDRGGKAVADFCSAATGCKEAEEMIDKLKKKLGVESLKDLFADRGPTVSALRRIIRISHPVPTVVGVKVSEGAGLSAKEKIFLDKRARVVAPVLKKVFGIDKPLRLAFCCSGGGVRAQIGTIGLLTAAAKSKFLQVATYLSGISGSTWFVAPWSYMYLKGFLPKDFNKSIDKFKGMLAETLSTPCQIKFNGGKCAPPLLGKDSAAKFSDQMAVRFAYGSKMSVVDYYGAIVGNYSLKNVGTDRLNVKWSDLAGSIQAGSIPFPLCSLAFDLKRVQTQTGYRTEYGSIETGPFEVGSKQLGGYVPVTLFGSDFDKGKISNQRLSYPMSFYLGMYGSAFSLSSNDLIEKVLPRPKFKLFGVPVELPTDSWMRAFIDEAKEGARAHRDEEIHARISNFSKDLSSSALKGEDYLSIFDGGLLFNIPLPLLFDRPERKVDIVIMYDSNPGDATTLIDASRYFKRERISMPDMEWVTSEFLLKKPMTVFNDPRDKKDYNPMLPTLIYFHTPKTDISKAPYNIDLSKYSDVTKPIDLSTAPYNTFNFHYSVPDINNLTQTIEAIFDSQVGQMKEVMQGVSKARLP